MHCRRCQTDVDAIVPWRGWSVARYGWYGMLGVLVLVFPIMACDYCVMIPTMMGIILAGGPLHWLARQKPVCTRCSLEL